MIHQIFNFIYNKLIQYNSNNYKWNWIFIIIWIGLYNYGYITENRILVFLIIILIICIYKIIYKYLKGINITINNNVLYIILWVDYLKLFLINLIINISIKLYELKLRKIEDKEIEIIKLLLENLLTNPLKLLLYKYYSVINNWRLNTIFQILFKRIYGSVLSILIFSNIIGYIWYILNYSVLNVYILLILINLIDEVSKLKEYSEYSFFKYVKYLNLNKDLFEIIELRSESSLFSLYIQKGLKNTKVWYNSNKIKSFAFSIHLYFKHKLEGYKIISLKNRQRQNALNKLRLNNNFLNFLHAFYCDIAISLNKYIHLLGLIEYIKIQKHYKLSEYELLKLKDLEEFILLVIKLLLYYLWDFENINKLEKDYIFDNLFIDEFLLIFSEYVFTENIVEKLWYIYHNKIKIFRINKNKEFYEQFYLYANLLNMYEESGVLDFGDYTIIERYTKILLNNLSTISVINNEEISYLKANDSDNKIEEEILNRLNKYKNEFIEEWKSYQISDIETANNQRLKHLNDYINKELYKNK